MQSKKVSYLDSGVDLVAAEEIVKKIKPIAELSHRSEVLSGIGGFNGIFELGKYSNPLLVSSSDGVGTKLKVAVDSNKFDAIGIDLVAMCVNDIITSGAEPLFFLDYISSGKLNVENTIKIVKSIAVGCKEAGCCLIGGETAEMPGLYNENEFDLAGFVVGVVEKSELIDFNNVESGDIIIGLSSTGLHSNGLSLCRKIFFDNMNLSPFGYVNCLNRPLFQELLEPTRIYVKAILDLKKYFKLKSIAHITGGGLIGNMPRTIPLDLQANIYNYSWEIPTLFRVIQNMSQLDNTEMMNIFNMGIGMTIVVKPKEADVILKHLNDNYYPAFVIGKISRKKLESRITFIDR